MSLKSLIPSENLLGIIWPGMSAEARSNAGGGDIKLENLLGVDRRTISALRRKRGCDHRTIKTVVKNLEEAGKRITLDEAIESPQLPDDDAFFTGNWWSYYADYGDLSRSRPIWWEEEVEIRDPRRRRKIVRFMGRCRNAKSIDYTLFAHRTSDGNFYLAAISDTRCFHAIMMCEVKKRLLGFWIGHTELKQVAVLPMLLSRERIKEAAQINALFEDVRVVVPSIREIHATKIKIIKRPRFHPENDETVDEIAVPKLKVFVQHKGRRGTAPRNVEARSES